MRESLRRELALGQLDPRPLDREPVGVQAQPGYEVDVLPPPLVAVARLTRRHPEHRRLYVLEEPGIALGVAALRLMTRGGDPPAEAPRKRPPHPDTLARAAPLPRSILGRTGIGACLPATATSAGPCSLRVHLPAV